MTAFAKICGWLAVATGAVGLGYQIVAVEPSWWLPATAGPSLLLVALSLAATARAKRRQDSRRQSCDGKASR